MSRQRYYISGRDEEGSHIVVDRKEKEILYVVPKKDVAEWLVRGLNKDNRTIFRKKRGGGGQGS